jgi:glycosyltransferase involved in cell wall biosynthesis
MPEVAGQAAILVDPYSIDQLVDAMMRVALDGKERLRLRRLGLHRAREFSWAESASMTLGVYEDVSKTRVAGMYYRH